MRNFSIIFLLFCVCTLASCKSTKNKGAGKLDKQTVRYAEQKLEENLLAPEWMSGKIKAKYFVDGDKQQGLIIDYRLQKDKAIWMSVSPNIGIKLEVGRALITPDRIQVMDKINKDYYDKPFKEIYEYIDYPINFTDLQNIILGNALVREGYQKLETKGDQYALTADGIFLFLNADYTVAQMVMEDAGGQGTINGNFYSYETIDNGSKFPNDRRYEMQSDKNYSLEMQFSKVATEGPLNMPFKPSSKYERKN